MKYTKETEKTDIELKQYVRNRVKELFSIVNERFAGEPKDFYTYTDILSEEAFNLFGIDINQKNDIDSYESDIDDNDIDLNIKTFEQYIQDDFEKNTIMSVGAIQSGDFVDFGDKGNLYVTGETKNTYKVTEDPAKRFSENDFEIPKKYAVRVIDKGDNFKNNNVNIA